MTKLIVSMVVCLIIAVVVLIILKKLIDKEHNEFYVKICDVILETVGIFVAAFLAIYMTNASEAQKTEQIAYKLLDIGCEDIEFQNNMLVYAYDMYNNGKITIDDLITNIIRIGDTGTIKEMIYRDEIIDTLPMTPYSMVLNGCREVDSDMLWIKSISAYRKENDYEEMDELYINTTEKLIQSYNILRETLDYSRKFINKEIGELQLQENLNFLYEKYGIIPVGNDRETY